MKFKDMKMHEEIRIYDCNYITRVPGGLRYTVLDGVDCISSIFVPMCHEFELDIPGVSDDN